MQCFLQISKLSVEVWSDSEDYGKISSNKKGDQKVLAEECYQLTYMCQFN